MDETPFMAQRRKLRELTEKQASGQAPTPSKKKSKKKTGTSTTD